jgi:hypothetical protein
VCAALGAQTRDILALVAGKGVTPTLVGVGIGCVAFAYMRSYSPYDNVEKQTYLWPAGDDVTQ